MTFEKPTMLYEYNGEKYYEVIDRHALDKTDLHDVVLNCDHEGKPLARTKNNTLHLEIDDIGLKVRAYLGGTDEGRRVFEEVKGGYFDKMSFAFIWNEEGNVYDRKTRTNRITDIKRLFDVSVVTFPAYDSTCVGARSQELFEAEALKERAEARREKRDALLNKLNKFELERKLNSYE